MARVDLDDSGAESPTEDDGIVKEAVERFRRCEQWESHARSLAEEDDKFFNGDSDNRYQWPDRIANDREINKKPVLTVNKTRQHCLMVENDSLQNKPGIVVHPTSDEASYEAAQAMEDVVRHIERRSHATNAYGMATRHQVRIGYGVLRVTTDYAGPDTFDQDIFIKAVKDPHSVYFDPDAAELDKSDSRFAFVFDDMPKDKFQSDYPDYADLTVGNAALKESGWMGDKHIRVAEYWRLRTVQDKLIYWVNPETGDRVNLRKSKVTPELWKQIKGGKDPTFRERDVQDNVLECFKIAGDEIIERKSWAGKWIPLVPVIGEEVVIGQTMDRRGHVRMMKDPQRIYNYMTSAQVETTALQTKTPFKGPAAAFEGYEDQWAQANKETLAYLPYNAYDDNGQPLPAPEREQPPLASEAILRGLEIAQNEMMMVSGQFQAQMGENENAKSGKAISERQRQGDNATYHFIDNFSVALRHLGRILVDLIPRIYDTKRVLLVEGLDGTKSKITIDPQQQQALQIQEMKKGEAAQMIFNPNVGSYSVDADVGPSYATRREEAWNAITQILTTAHDLTPVIGDILFRNADFPGADEIAERLRRVVNPVALGEQPPPQVQQAMQQSQEQIQRLQNIVNDLMQQLAEQKLKLAAKDAQNAGREAQKEIDAYDAVTRRATAISNAEPELGLDMIRPAVEATLREMLGFSLGGVEKTMGGAMQSNAGNVQGNA